VADLLSPGAKVASRVVGEFVTALAREAYGESLILEWVPPTYLFRASLGWDPERKAWHVLICEREDPRELLSSLFHELHHALTWTLQRKDGRRTGEVHRAIACGEASEELQAATQTARAQNWREEDQFFEAAADNWAAGMRIRHWPAVATVIQSALRQIEL
jgi:hypothetical protein